MAEIVLGIGTSHGPLLNTPPEEWGQRAEADRRNPSLFFRGRPYNFAALTDVRAAEQLEREITPERMAERHAACQRAIDAVADTLARVAPDTVVIVGDDQEEVFYDDNMPALSVYWGETLDVGPLPEAYLATRPPGLNIADWGYYPPEPATAPCEPKLGLHIIQSLIEEGFDVAHTRRLPPGRAGNHPVPHAYGFVYRRLMHDQIIPNVPVFINTFYPPNQPTLPRCYAFGQALGRAVASWSSDKRVAIIASGGLSHFVIEEDLDRQVLDAMQERDADRLLGLPVEYFESGTSEIRNWIALAGAMADTDLRMQLVDYVPCYRSVAGTGNAMGFAQWL
jgi:Catalytic LigB subunit of aromatic ring-opening dioxygenase